MKVISSGLRIIRWGHKHRPKLMFITFIVSGHVKIIVTCGFVMSK